MLCVCICFRGGSGGSDVEGVAAMSSERNLEFQLGLAWRYGCYTSFGFE
jgi:hypothetical protein